MGIQDKVKKIWEKNKKALKTIGFVSVFAAGFSMYMVTCKKTELKPLVIGVDVNQDSGNEFHCPGENYPDSMTLADAIGACFSAIKSDPKNPFLRERIGDLYHYGGNIEKAVSEHERAIRLDSGNIGLRRDILDIYMKAGRIGDAIRESQHILGIGNHDIRDMMTMGMIYSEAQLYSKAIETFEEVIKIQPLNRGARHNLGMVYLEQNDLKNAEKYFKEALKLGENANTHFFLGLAYYQEGMPKDAKFECMKAMALDDGKMTTDIYILLAIVHRKGKDYTQAIEYLSRAASAEPNNFYPHYELAKTYTTLGGKNRKFYRDAENEFRISLNLNYKSSDSHEGLGCLYMKTKRFDEAKEEFRLALKYDPNNRSARSNLNRL